MRRFSFITFLALIVGIFLFFSGIKRNECVFCQEYAFPLYTLLHDGDQLMNEMWNGKTKKSKKNK